MEATMGCLHTYDFPDPFPLMYRIKLIFVLTCVLILVLFTL